MFITPEDLERYKACENGKRYIKRFHPDGFEMSELVLDHHVPKVFVHWARNNLPCTQEEKMLYDQRMKISNSEDYHCSHSLRNTKYVKYSWDIEDSCHVFNSESISNSENIVKSEQINLSKNIFFSEFVENSEKIYFGKNVISSFNIVMSSIIVNSQNIYKSENILNSSELVNCKDTTSSYFCTNCTQIENCLFCNNLNNQSYCIFNKPIGKERFEIFLAQYKKMIMGVTLDFCEYWPPEKLLVLQEPKRSSHQFLYYQALPEKFWKWARTLPNFNSMLIYNITMLPDFLV